VRAQVPGGTLDPDSIPKYQTPLLIPPAMARAGKLKQKMAKNVDYYEIAMRQFQQQILPAGLPATTVWGYGPAVAQNGPAIFNAPSLTIEAKWNKPVRIKWINELVDANGNYLPHILPVDQTLHWANPPGGTADRDTRGNDPAPYMGPVPIVTHVHGAHTYEESDGYPEMWYLPNAGNIPAGHATVGSIYDQFNSEFQTRYGAPAWEPGTSVFQYPNDQRATTLWYHDHTLGMTRLNVYAGPAGFYIVRGGPDDIVLDGTTGLPAVLPGPAPALGDAPGTPYYEIPIVVQDRSFNADGSLFFPDNRAFFEGLDPSQLQIPFIPDVACDGGINDVSPIWNPEFFGNTMMVNGNTWPYLDVEQRRYRFRFLNGCNSRFLLLQFSDPRVEVWQIGAEGGFLPAPVNINAVNGGRILMALAERADLIVDFANVPVGTEVLLLNLGPDEPFGGGEPPGDFDAADPATTGQVMQFRVGPAISLDLSTPPQNLVLPAITPLAPTSTRQVTLNEEESATVLVSEDADGNVVLDCIGGTPFGPTSALLGTLNADGTSTPLKWMEPTTENPVVGSTETWEIYNFTMDAHPIHVHLVQFQVVNREGLLTGTDGMATQPAVLLGNPRLPEAWETGFKDTVIAYPGEVTRIKARFDYPGLYVWHCHIIDHEDNEMMRPYRVLP
jgi:spore coat protein A